MSWRGKGFFCLGLMVTLNSAGRAASETMSTHEESPEVTILSFYIVSLSEKIQKTIRDGMDKIYRQAGVELEWVPCPTKEKTPALYPE